jgi:lysophospholipase L1-like esterase
MANKTMSNLQKVTRVSNLKEATTISNGDVLLVETATETLKVTKGNLLKEVNEELNAKSDANHTHDEYVTESELNSKGLATEMFVTNKIAEAQLGNDGGNMDLSGYATTEYVDQEVGKTNAQLSHKASILDLDTERKRIDSFTKLEDGSTTGDAELIDARTVNGTTYDTLGSAIRAISKGESLTENSVHISNLSEEFYSKTDNEIRIVKATIDNTDFNFSLNNDYLHLSGESNNAVNIVLYVDKPKLTVGNHYLKFFTILASNVVTLEFTFSDGSFIKNYMNNSNVSTLVLDCEKTLEKIRIGITANTRVSFENYIKLTTSPTGGYTPKYESKILTTNNVSTNPFKGKKWVCIGDSITYGYYTTTEGRAGRYQWQEEVANKLEMTFVNLGVSGSTTAGFLRSEIVDNIPSDVDIISVMGGTNDYGQNVNPNDVEGYEYNTGTYPGSIRLVIKYLVENFPNAKIIFCNCIGGGHKSSGNQTLYKKNTVNKTYADYAKICIDTANELSIPCIDLFSESGVNLLNRSTMISDSVHPTIEGYKRISEVYIDNFERYKVYLTSTI